MSQGPYAGPPQKSGGGGMTMLVIVLVIFGIIGVACAGICGLGIFGLRWTAENGPKLAENIGKTVGDAMLAGVMQFQAAAAVQADPQVREKLGDPLTLDAQDSQNTDLSTGTASFDFNVSGPKGKGKAHGEGHREGEQWKITKLQVHFDDGSTVDVDPSLGGQPSIDVNSPTPTPPTTPDQPETPEPTEANP